MSPFSMGLAALLWAAQSGSLSWDAPLACPGPAQFEAALLAYLGEAEREQGWARPGLEVEARVSQGTDYRLQLVLRTTAGDRVHVQHHELRGNHCDEVAERAAALAATLIDPFAGVRSEAIAPFSSSSRHTAPVVQHPRAAVPSPPPARAPLAPAIPSPDTDIATDETEASGSELDASSSSSNTAPSLNGYAAVAGGLGIALFPRVDGAIHAQLGLEIAALRVGVHGGVDLGGTLRSVDEPDLGAVLLIWELGLRACAAPQQGRLGLHGCLVAAAGQLRARPLGFEGGQNSATPWAWLGPELGIAYAVHPRLSVALELGLGLPVYRSSVAIVQPDANYRVPSVFGRLALGLRVNLPSPDRL